MLRTALLILAAACIYAVIKYEAEKSSSAQVDRAADAQWANEGGAHAPGSV